MGVSPPMGVKPFSFSDFKLQAKEAEGLNGALNEVKGAVYYQSCQSFPGLEVDRKFFDLCCLLLESRS